MNYHRLKEIDHISYLENEPLSQHTSFKIGGPADLFLIPEDRQALSEVIRICHEDNIPFFLIGNGSNMLIRDGGYRGVVISTEKLQGIDIDGERLTALAGDSLSQIAKVAQQAGLTGLEFASGIPGSLGGGLRMNAGAYDGELKDVVESAEVIFPDGHIETLGAEELHFGYRHSRFQEELLYMLSATLKLAPGDREAILAKMNDLNQRRRDKQPLEYPSAGSTFRRPQGYFAGKLIQDSGMQGARVGGAQVSEKHAGFVINRDHATAQDVLNLIKKVQDAVYDQFGVELKTEVIPIGEDPED